MSTPDNVIAIERRIAASPERVWRAWTDPERLAAWFGPNGFRTETAAFDLRPGGEWRFVMRHDEHGSFGNLVRFLEVDAPRRLVYEHLGDDAEHQHHVEVRFEPDGDGTLLSMRSTFPTAEACRRVVEQYGAIEGGHQTLARLAAHVEPVPRRPEGPGRFRVAAFGVSADGFGAGPDQSLEHPLGRGGERLHDWFFPTATFQRMHGDGDGETGLDDAFARYGFDGVGAWILGRNMFGPVRGPWGDGSWRGWWGEEPPYHVPVFVLTHHERPPLQMAGGTTFHFVTDGIGAALRRAREAAGPDRDVRLGGGVATVRQYLAAGLLDELHLAVAPALLGAGEPLLHGLDLPALGYAVARHAASERALHLVVRRSD